MKHHPLTSQQGQSIAEFVVALLVLTPFFIIVPKVAAYIEVAQISTAASRFAGFETSMYHQTRFWDGIYQETKKSTGSVEEDEKEMEGLVKKYFYDNNRSAKELVEKVEVTREHEGEMRWMTNYMTNVRHTAMDMWLYSWGLGSHEYRIAKVNVSLKDLPWKADVAGPTNMERYIVVPFNDWAARGPNDHKTRLWNSGMHYPRMRIRFNENNGFGLAATSVFGVLNDSYTMEGAQMPLPLGALLTMEQHTVKATGFNGEELWEIDVENVPKDRLR